MAKVIGRESRQKAIFPDVIDGGGIQILDIDDPFSQPCRRDSPTPNERSRQQEQRIAPQQPGPITLVLDNARYQHCARVINLAATLNIRLLMTHNFQQFNPASFLAA